MTNDVQILLLTTDYGLRTNFSRRRDSGGVAARPLWGAVLPGAVDSERCGRKLSAGVPCKSAAGTKPPTVGGVTHGGGRLHRWQTHQGVSLLGHGNMPPVDHVHAAVVGVVGQADVAGSCCQRNYRRAVPAT